MTLQAIFIHNLKYFRKKSGMTQNELTLALNKGYNYINGIEQGRSFPSPDVIEQIAKELDIRAVQLFDENAVPQTAILADRDSFIEALADKVYARAKADLRENLSETLAELLH